MTTKMTRNAVALLGMLATTMPAAAGGINFSLDINRHSRNGRSVSIGISAGEHRRAIPVKQIWVTPVYRTVTERVWVPTVQTAYRDVPVVDSFGQVISYRREPYTIESGYWNEVHRQVLVRAGYWTTAPISRRHRPSALMGLVRGHSAFATTAPGIGPRRTGHAAPATFNTRPGSRHTQPAIPRSANRTGTYERSEPRLQQVIQQLERLRTPSRAVARSR